MPKTVAQTSFLFLSSLIFIALSGCVVPPTPYEEYTLARAAIQAAKDVDSARFSSGLWHRAEESFRSGEKAWKNREFGEAKKLFERATLYAERAENSTRLKKFKSGDSFP